MRLPSPPAAARPRPAPAGKQRPRPRTSPRTRHPSPLAATLDLDPREGNAGGRGRRHGRCTQARPPQVDLDRDRHQRRSKAGGRAGPRMRLPSRPAADPRAAARAKEPPRPMVRMPPRRATGNPRASGVDSGRRASRAAPPAELTRHRHRERAGPHGPALFTYLRLRLRLAVDRVVRLVDRLGRLAGGLFSG